MEDRWDCMKVVCIKEYETIKVGSHYSIRGRGDLSWNSDPEVKGIILLNKKCQNTLSQKVKIIKLIKETKK
jgi:hypothetical protein